MKQTHYDSWNSRMKQRISRKISLGKQDKANVGISLITLLIFPARTLQFCRNKIRKSQGANGKSDKGKYSKCVYTCIICTKLIKETTNPQHHKDRKLFS